jgi:hypothetical protein
VYPDGEDKRRDSLTRKGLKLRQPLILITFLGIKGKLVNGATDESSGYPRKPVKELRDD